VLGTESGASVFDFTGEVQAAVERDLQANPAIPYEELRRRHFAHLEGRILLNQISPRCFEAAALRTLMVLYEGSYSGLLTPWRHYVPLCKDHRNMAEVVAVLRDPARMQEIVDAAYREVACNPRNSFAALSSTVDAVLSGTVGTRPHRSIVPYTDLEFAQFARGGAASRRRRMQRRVVTYGHLIVFRYVLRLAPPQWRDRIRDSAYRILRPIYRALFS
jgi:hypothetical protein